MTGLYYLNAENNIIKHYLDEEIFLGANLIQQIQYDEATGSAWLASTEGMIYLNFDTGEKHLFTGNSGSNYLSPIHSSFKFKQKMYFAGTNGYLNFNPKDITFPKKDIKIIIEELYIMNDTVTGKGQASNDFKLNSAIEKTGNLNFSYKDKLITVEFIALNFNNAIDIKYAYKLNPVFDNWVELPSGNRRLTFTNLQPGRYNLALRATNLDRSWSNQITFLEFNIHPAPWLTWWAYLIYVISFIFFMYLYIRNKLIKQKKLNLYLKTQVKKQTEHIEKQKEALELLMERKNEIFTNVTHEFRTPITLIQGPIVELEKNEKNKKKLDMLAMMSRNSGRLLKLVNQMLTLSQIVENTDQNKKPIKITPKLQLIVEPYIYAAKKKRIALSIDHIEDVEIAVTLDTLEIIIGNFLSNAIKYTQVRGNIKLGTRCKNNAIEIFVKDDGYEFDQQHQEFIFKRFSRLSEHHEIEGVGIGQRSCCNKQWSY